jgi:hypothetical protein
MFSFIPPVHDLYEDPQRIRKQRYGVIEVIDGELCCIRFRLWPKLISHAEIGWFGAATHQRRSADRCLLYYNQPLSHSNYLALKYVVSNHGTRYRTFRKTLTVLDQIAQIKRSDALLCEASNQRISDRYLQRMGWERHLVQSRRRHYIKRFYGVYPQSAVPAESDAQKRESAA